MKIKMRVTIEENDGSAWDTASQIELEETFQEVDISSHLYLIHQAIVRSLEQSQRIRNQAEETE